VIFFFNKFDFISENSAKEEKNVWKIIKRAGLS